jgi:hypothetical protein
MSDVPAPIGFPLNLDAQPILAYAQSVRQFSVGLQLQARSLADATQVARSNWQGSASDAFATKAILRAQDLMQASQLIDGAPDQLVLYADTIKWAQNAHAEAMRTYYVAWNQRPYSDPVLHQCVAIQREVIDTMNTVAERCAAALQSIRSHFVYLSIGLPLPGELEPFPKDLYNNGPYLSPSPPSMRPGPVDYTSALKAGKYTYKAGLWSVEAFEIYLHHNKHDIAKMIETYGRNGGKPFIRNGKDVLAWKPGANLTATEGTLAETTARLGQLSAKVKTLKVWIKGGNVVGAALSGGFQLHEDWDKDFSVGQRTARAATATVLEGGGAWAGFVAGAALGGAVGTGFGIVGAVPGAIIGGLFGLGGALLGGWLGKKAKEEVFEHGSEEVFGGN